MPRHHSIQTFTPLEMNTVNIPYQIAQAWQSHADVLERRAKEAFRPCDRPRARAVLKTAGIVYRTDTLPLHINLIAVGEDTPLGQAMRSGLIDFLPGTSDEQMVKVLFGGYRTSVFKELQTLLRQLSGENFLPAKRPNSRAIHEREQQFAAIRSALVEGKATDMGIEYSLWKEGIWAIGAPEVGRAHEVLTRPVASSSSIQEVEILWPFRGVPVPVGRAFHLRGKVALLLDGRPYMYGFNSQVGRKELLLIKFSPRERRLVKERVMSSFKQFAR